MKILFFILLFFLFIIAVLSCSKLTFSFRFDGNLLFKIRLLFFSFKFKIPILYKPKIEKEVSEAIKKEPENKKKINKKGKTKKKEKEKIPFPGIKNTLTLFRDSIGIISKSFKGAFRLEKLHFKAVAASKDAATTAELYGLLCTLGTVLHQFASNSKGIKNNNVYVEIVPDFIAEKADIYGDIKFSIRVFRILLMGKNAFSVYNAYKKLALSVAKEAQNVAEETSQTTEKTNN